MTKPTLDQVLLIPAKDIWPTSWTEDDNRYKLCIDGNNFLYEDSTPEQRKAIGKLINS